MGKYRKKELPEISIELRKRDVLEGLGLQPISKVTLVRAGQINKTGIHLADKQKNCSICGLKVWGRKWTWHWRKAHNIREKKHMHELFEG